MREYCIQRENNSSRTIEMEHILLVKIFLGRESVILAAACKLPCITLRTCYIHSTEGSLSICEAEVKIGRGSGGRDAEREREDIMGASHALLGQAE